MSMKREIQFDIIRYESIDSTSNQCALFARDGAPEGVVVVSKFQTAGRGRYDRQWVSPPGANLLFSLLLRPPVRVAHMPLITHFIACLLQESIVQFAGVRCALKKPNDLLLRGQKVCGILTESQSHGTQVDYVVVGIGVNVNAGPGDHVDGATSLHDETGDVYDCDALLTIFLREFQHNYNDFCANCR